MGFIGYLAQLFKVLLAAIIMLLLALGLWLLVGITSTVLGIQSPTFVLISVGLIAVIAFAAGGYLSARYITPRSWLHPMLASLVIGLLYLTRFSSGEVGALHFGLLLIVSVITAGGAVLGRNARPSNNSSGG